MSNKLDIKNELKAISTRDRNWYKSLTEEEKKKYDKQMWVQMRWVSGYKYDRQGIVLQLVNEYVNKDFNTLRHHPQLQHYLLQLAGTGESGFCYEWMAPGKGIKKDKFMTWLAEQFPEYNDAELELFAQTNGKETFVDRMEQQGMTKKEIKEIFK